MKKLGISLLVLALVLSFVSANAAIGVRSSITGAAPTSLVIGLNNIDLLVHYKSIGNAAANTQADTDMGVGATFYFAKLGEVKVGGNLSYFNNGNAGVASGTSVGGTATLSLGLDVQAPIANGLSVGVLANVFQSNNNTPNGGGTGTSSSDLGVFAAASVYVQATAF